MKCKRLGLVLVLVVAIACLASFSCVKGGGDGDDNDDSKTPNFVQSGSGPKDFRTPDNPNATSITYYSYVKNIGGNGKISMTIGAGDDNATREFDVTAGTSYVFQATVSCVKQNGTTFTYSAKFPGTPGYLDTHTEPNYHHTGAPKNMQLNKK